MNKIKLNAEKIGKLPVGLHHDHQQGLCIRVSATCKSWYLYVWSNGEPIKRSLGKFPNMSVEEARKAARAKQGELDNGIQEIVETTLDDLFNRYDKHLRAKGIRHPQYARELYELSWKHLANRTLSSLKTSDLQEEHDKIAIARGRAAAARAIKIMRAFYTFAIDMDLHIGKNPAKRVRIFAGSPRDVFLNTFELTVLREVLDEQPVDVSDFFKLCLLTGARRGNVESMRWADIRGDTWTIPASQSKNNKAYEVPLHPLVQQILQRRSIADLPQRSAFVFPTWSASGHLADAYPWLEIVRKACAKRGMTKHFTLHDLRRTFATMLTANGISLSVVSKALGHTNVQTTPTYARADTETVRQALLLSPK